MRTKKMIYGGLLTVGLVLPQAFHVFGQGVGMAFLPMHLPVMIAGILLGPCYGGLIGLIVPLVSSMLTGMPPVPNLYFMIVELVNFHWNFYQKNECVFHFAQRDDPWKSVVWMFLDHWC